MLSKHTLDALILLASIGNFKGTAAALGTSPVKLTRMVQRAENDCGFQIFSRSRAATVPTVRGKQLLEACKELSLAAVDFERRLDAIQGNTSESLRVSCGPLATHTVLLPLLRGLLEELPDVAATIIVSAHREPIQQLREGKIDLFIGDLTHSTPFDDIEVMVLEKREVIFVARPENPIINGGPYSLSDLLQRRLALPHIHKYWQTTFNDALQAAGATAPTRIPQIETDDYQTLISLAATTDIITAGTQAQLDDALASGILARISMSHRIQYNICCACLDPHAMNSLERLWMTLADNYCA
ncbi:Uncharacterised protein [Halioglobus japonicus]|nr:Uncharacterised protein [Halioglobus japonicus]